MKRFRVMAAALCAAVLLCGFSVPAYAYADGGEGADYGDPTMTEETPAPEPEPTIEPGEGFSEEGNLVTRDLLYDEHTNKQFITVQTAGGNTFYIVIDYDKPVDEEGEQYETYFFSVVDEADLLDAEAPCSQYDLCSEWSIPKQTINTAVAALQKKGVAFLSPIPGTRNKKNIAFTEFGRDFAEKTVGILRMAELDALAELSPEERELYIRLNEKYNCRLIEKLYRIMDEVNQDRKDCD